MERAHEEMREAAGFAGGRVTRRRHVSRRESREEGGRGGAGETVRAGKGEDTEERDGIHYGGPK